MKKRKSTVVSDMALVQGISFPKTLLAWAKLEAGRQHRSLSNYICSLLVEAMKRNGAAHD